MKIGTTELSMRMRIVLSVAALTLFITVVASIGFDAYVGSATRATLERSLRGRMDRLQIATQRHLIQLNTSGKKIILVPDQSVSQVLSKNLRILYTTKVAGAKALLTWSQMNGHLGKPYYITLPHQGSSSPYILLIEKIPSTHGELAIVGSSTDKVDDSLNIAEELLAIGGISAIIFASLGAGLLASIVLKPVERMRKQAQDLSKGHSMDRLSNPGTGDELAALADTLNEFLTKIHDSTQLQRRFIASASHELRTPLAGMKAELDSRWSSSFGSDPAILMDRIEKRVDNLIYLTDGLLKVAQGQSKTIPLKLTDSDLESVISATLTNLSPQASAAQVRLVLDVTQDVHAYVDPVRICEIWENLTLNAIRHSRPGGIVEITIDQSSTQAIIAIRDHGDGFDREILDHVFEPFVSTSPGSNNFGLGLSLVKHLVVAHGGEVEARNHDQGGAVVTVRLPKANPVAGS
ncbi:MULTISPECIES: HAMP domain-containing sensor histidine kinase [Acidithrix]|uniref:histidine kinase n=1 Tax=Acidithrix ferrooxidans TaxID=1280514 RepID=A0A0D8HMJ1_9ACTN|nr:MULTISPECIES: HAMP domain-containing sensor histidine kinase [Acidithrix]KJF18311.1 alginate biosynthesis sensor protein KinB [Acidithrix ferrooxidans]